MACLSDEKERLDEKDVQFNKLFLIGSARKEVDNGKDCLHLHVKDRTSKQVYSNNFNVNQLKQKGLHQSLDQIIRLYNAAKDNQSSNLSFKIGYCTHCEKNTNISELGSKLSNICKSGDTLYIIVGTHEAWFHGHFVFMLKLQGMTNICNMQ